MKYESNLLVEIKTKWNWISNLKSALVFGIIEGTNDQWMVQLSGADQVVK